MVKLSANLETGWQLHSLFSYPRWGGVGEGGAAGGMCRKSNFKLM